MISAASKRAGLVVLLAAVLLSSCASPKAGCPDRYDGQTTSVTGVITSSSSALGLAQLTTVKDAAGNVCLLVSRSALGKVGDTITVAEQVAITNTAKTPPKYLYPASDPDLGK